MKKSEKSNGGKYDIFRRRRTSRNTDGAGYIGPADRQGQTMAKNENLLNKPTLDWTHRF